MMPLALFGSLVTGAGMPLLGYCMAMMLAVLTPPLILLPGGADYVESETKYYAAGIGILALTTGLGTMLSKWAFGALGRNVTYEIRTLLYARILSKNIGFFDAKENGTSVLTSAMEEDAAVINGVGGESLGPVADALCAVSVGLAVGFYYCW